MRHGTENYVIVLGYPALGTSPCLHRLLFKADNTPARQPMSIKRNIHLILSPCSSTIPRKYSLKTLNLKAKKMDSLGWIAEKIKVSKILEYFSLLMGDDVYNTLTICALNTSFVARSGEESCGVGRRMAYLTPAKKSKVL